MSTKAQVLSNLFYYTCAYLISHMCEAYCCCPQNTFTFDITQNEETKEYDVLTYTSWNFECPQPTLADLMQVTPEQALVREKKTRLRNGDHRVVTSIDLIKRIFNLGRNLNRDLTDDDLLEFV